MIIKEDGPARPDRDIDNPTIPRSFAIIKRDLANYCYTPACPGCYAAANDRKRKSHTPVCRDRISKELADDETQSHRVIDAKEREDAFLENAIREADVDRVNKDANPPVVHMPKTSVETPVTTKEQMHRADVEESMTYEDM